LASDLNLLFAQAGIDDVVQAGVYTKKDVDGNIIEQKLTLRALQPAVGAPSASLSAVRSLTLAGGGLLGFSASQDSDYADLAITVDDGFTVTTYDVNLDGAVTVQDVMDAITTQTSNMVAVS